MKQLNTLINMHGFIKILLLIIVINFFLLSIVLFNLHEMSMLKKDISTVSNSKIELEKRKRSKLADEYNTLLYNTNILKYLLFIVPMIFFTLLFLKNILL